MERRADIAETAVDAGPSGLVRMSAPVASVRNSQMAHRIGHLRKDNFMSERRIHVTSMTSSMGKPPLTHSGSRMPPLAPPTSISGTSPYYSASSATPASSVSTAATASALTATNSLFPSRRSNSQEEMQRLLAKTNAALDRIVAIRKSMEKQVDFSQFQKAPRRPKATHSVTTAAAVQKPSSLDRLLLETHLDDPTRTTPASSYGSTDTSSSDDEPNIVFEEGHVSESLVSVATSKSDDLSCKPHHEDDGSETTSSHSARSESSDSISSSTRDSSFSNPELSIFKEQRMDRLKNIEMHFYEGLPREFFMAMCRFLHATIEVKTRHSKFSFFKDTFTGSDAVRQLITFGFAEDQPVAIRYGNVLVKLGFIEHVSRTNDQLHNSKDNFYRFTKALDYSDGDFYAETVSRFSSNSSNLRESELSRDSGTSVEYDFAEASDEVHALATEESLLIVAKVLHKVFERKNKLLFYKGFVGCFLGAEAVNVIRELHLTNSLIDAILLGQSLLDEGIIEPVATNITSFQDKYIFYRLTRVRM